VRKVPKPGLTCITVPVELYNYLKSKAKEQKITIAGYIRKLLILASNNGKIPSKPGVTGSNPVGPATNFFVSKDNFCLLSGKLYGYD